MSIDLKVPDLQELKPRITVIGVGGAGGNAVNNMIASGLSGVDFVVANTDAQALTMSSAPTRLQIGVNTTEGLGAGSRPEIGRDAASEAESDIRAQVAGAHMVFVAAGMGGGTGTGAAPVISRIAREEGVLTVGVVTKPFHFEGGRRMRTAEVGLKELRENVDTLIVIPNQNLFRIANEKTTFAEAFKLADKVLHSGIACVTDLIVKDGLINLDFADVRAVMDGMGSAVMGTGQSSGEQRAIEAAEEAIANPLLDDVSLQGAKGLLISITGGDDLTLYEVDEAATRIRNEVDPDANIILGAAFDDTLNGEIRVSIVASGVDEQHKKQEKPVDLPLQNSLQHRLTNVASEPGAESHQVNDPQQIQPETVPTNVEVHMTDGVQIEARPPHMIAGDNPEIKPQGGHPAHHGQNHGAEDFVPAPPVSAPKRPARMPEMEDFPPHTQNSSGGKAGNPQKHGIQDQKRRLGFFEKLTSVARQKMPSDSSHMTKQSRSAQDRNGGSVTQGHKERAVANGPVNIHPGPAGPNRGAADNSSTGPVNVRGGGNRSGESIDIPPFLRKNKP